MIFEIVNSLVFGKLIKACSLLLFAWVLSSSCSYQKEVIASDVKKLVVDEKYLVVKPVLTETMMNVKLIALESNASSLVSEVNKIAYFQGRYVLQDTYIASTIVAFDSTGKFMCKYGGKGLGESSYKLPMDFYVDKSSSELIVLNSEIHNLNFYDLYSGLFKRAVPYSFPVHRLCKISKNSFAFVGAAKDKKIIFSDGALKRKSSFINYEEKYSLGLINPFTVLNDSTKLVRLSYDNTIYRLKENGIVPYLFIDFLGNAFTNAFYNELNAPQKRRLAEYTSTKMCNISTFYETDDAVVFTFRWKKSTFMCIQDKHSLHIKFFDEQTFDDDVLFLEAVPTILGTDSEGYFLSVLSAAKLTKSSKLLSLPNKKSALLSVFFAESKNQITELSNPIILKYKFKPF